jgi:hypothetical protein
MEHPLDRPAELDRLDAGLAAVRRATCVFRRLGMTTVLLRRQALVLFGRQLARKWPGSPSCCWADAGVHRPVHDWGGSG